MIWKFLKQNVLFPKGLNWVQHWVSRIGLLFKECKKYDSYLKFLLFSKTTMSKKIKMNIQYFKYYNHIIIQLKKYLSSWMLKRDVLSGSKIAILIQRAKVGKKTRHERIYWSQLRYDWRFPFFFFERIYTCQYVQLFPQHGHGLKGSKQGRGQNFSRGKSSFLNPPSALSPK